MDFRGQPLIVPGGNIAKGRPTVFNVAALQILGNNAANIIEDRKRSRGGYRGIAVFNPAIGNAGNATRIDNALNSRGIDGTIVEISQEGISRDTCLL